MVVQSQFIEQFSDERWPLKSISELCDIVTDGEHQTPRRVDSGIYLLSARNVKNQELSFDDVDYIDEQEYQRIAKRIEPQENDVLISCSGSVGRTCVVPKGIRFQLVRSVALLRFKPLVDPLFMSYQMAMPYVQSQIETLKSQTSQANLFQGNIKKIQVIVPSKEEQKRFIIVVRKADKSKFDGLKSQFIEMFGDPITNSKGRKQKPFIEVVTLHRGYDLPEGKRVQSGSIPIYGANGFLGYHDCAMAKDGIVTGRSGAIGEVYEVPGPYWPLNTALFSIDTHGNNITYLTYLLRFFDIKRFGTGTGVPTLNRNDVHKEMIYDVELTEQSAFEKIAKQADKSKYLS